MRIDKELIARAFEDAESLSGWAEDRSAAWLRVIAYLILYYIKYRGANL